MEIFLVRHGIAESEIVAARCGRRDEERRLTAEGTKETMLVADYFRRHIESLDRILHSPFARAQETAEIFAARFREARLEGADGLTPESDPRQAAEFFASLEGAKRIMVVSHEPFLSAALSYLLTGGFGLSSGFERSAVAGIEWHGAGASRLIFLAPPWLLLEGIT